MFSIKSLKREDLPSLRRIYIKTIHDDFPEYGKKTLDHFTSRAYWKKMANLEVKLGAFWDGELVGFLLASRPEGGVLSIYWLSVGRNYRGRGIGTALLSHAEKKALKMGVHNIRVDCDKRLCRFYKKHGFEVMALDKKGYYGVDNYIMRKIIAEPKEKNFLNRFNT